MERSKIFAEILADVVRVSEITEKELLSHKREADVVDARHLLFYLLSKEGIYPNVIARYFNMNRRAVNSALNKFEDRLSVSPMLRRNYNVLKNRNGGG